MLNATARCTRPLLPLLAVALTILAAAPAAAEPQSCPVNFTHEENIVDLLWDTDWVPAGEKIQVRLTFDAKAGINARLAADALLERPGDLRYQGREGQGELKMGLWTHLRARYRIQNLEWNGISLDHEGDLPIPASFHNTANNIIEDAAAFNPLLLPGASPRPVSVSLAPPKYTLLTLEVPVFDISVVELSITVPIKVQPILGCELQGERIETLPAGATQPLRHEAEGASMLWPHTQNLHQQGDATYHASRALTIDLAVYPEIIATATIDLGIYDESETWKVAEFELTQRLATLDGSWRFAPQPLSWEFPPDPPAGDGGQSLFSDGAPGPGPGPAPRSEAGLPLSDGGGGSAANALQITGGCCALAGAHATGQLDPLVLLLLGLAWLQSRRGRK